MYFTCLPSLPFTAFDLGTSSALSGFTLSPTAPGSVPVPGSLAVTVAGDNLVDQVSQDQVIITFTNDDVFPQMSAEILIFDDETPGEFWLIGIFNPVLNVVSVSVIFLLHS